MASALFPVILPVYERDLFTLTEVITLPPIPSSTRSWGWALNSYLRACAVSTWLSVWWCTLLDERLPAAQITQAAS